MNPLFQLQRIARIAKSDKDYDTEYRLAKAIRSARLVMGASEVVLDSWTEFETWFHKNRAQGLEFVFDDKYGKDSPESDAIAQLVEGYDMLERKLHDVYVMLQERAASETPAVVSEPDAEPDDEESADETATDETAEATDETAEEVTSEESAEEPAAEEDTTEADELLTSLEEPAEGEEEASAEEPAAEAEAEAESEEEVAQKGAAVTDQTKMIRRVQQMLKRASVEVPTVMFRGGSTYRLVCSSADDLDRAAAFMQQINWGAQTVDHPVKHMLDIVPGKQ